MSQVQDANDQVILLEESINKMVDELLSEGIDDIDGEPGYLWVRMKGSYNDADLAGMVMMGRLRAMMNLAQRCIKVNAAAAHTANATTQAMIQAENLAEIGHSALGKTLTNAKILKDAIRQVKEGGMDDPESMARALAQIDQVENHLGDFIEAMGGGGSS